MQPPLVAVPLHPFPVKQGVTPELAVLRKGVRGTPGHFGGAAPVIQLKLLRTGPHVGAVQGGVDGQIPQDGDALLVGIGLQLFPLLAEQILNTLPEVHLAS